MRAAARSERHRAHDVGARLGILIQKPVCACRVGQPVLFAHVRRRIESVRHDSVERIPSFKEEYHEYHNILWRETIRLQLRAGINVPAPGSSGVGGPV